MKKSCYYCSGIKVKKFGRTKSGRQRFYCLNCLRTYIWRSPWNKLSNERKWFKSWIKEGYSIRQISVQSGYGEEKIKRIKSYWLKEEPPVAYTGYKRVKYLIFDGTYFNKRNCLLVFMNNVDGKIVGCKYLDKEDYENVLDLACDLRLNGVNPRVITLDGHQGVIKAVKEVWPAAEIQRCLYHIQRQGLMWLRRKPKTQIGRDLRIMLKSLCQITIFEEMVLFSDYYVRILMYGHEEMERKRSNALGVRDARKVVSLIGNAYPDMWHFLKDRKIPKTTNKLEGYFGELKQKYVRHKGMWARSREQYLKWYCYYKNN